MSELLSRIEGEVENLNLLPLMGCVRDEQLDRVQAWAEIYRSKGLPFARSKPEADEMRQLAAEGLVKATGGKTKAAAHKLTWRGLWAALPYDGVTPEQVINFLRAIAPLAEPVPGWRGQVHAVLGWRIVPTAAAYAYGGDPKPYVDQLGKLDQFLAPILIMGWVSPMVNMSGNIWAVQITEEGAAAIESPPELTVEVGTAYNFDSWCEGHDHAREHYPRTERPPAARNWVFRRLSSGMAWQDCPKKATKETTQFWNSVIEGNAPKGAPTPRQK